MKTYTSILFLTVLIFMLPSCTSIEVEPDFTVATNQVINVDDLEVTPLKFSSYFDRVDYVPLQAADVPLIEFVSNASSYNNRYFVLDVISAKRFFIFDDDGNFVSSIGDVGNGEGEFHELIDFSIATNTEEIYLLDRTGKINVYSLDGEFIRKILITGPTNHSYNNLEIVGKSIFLDVSYPQTYLSKKNYLLREVSLNGTFIHDWLDVDVFNKGAGILPYANFAKSLFATPNGVFYGKEFMDVIYKLEENSVVPFKTIESQAKMTNQDIAGMSPAESTYDQAMSLDKIFSISQLVMGENFSYFSYKKGFGPFSVVEKNGTTFLHQYWVDDVSFSGKSFQVQPPRFLATAPDGKTLIGVANGKQNWHRGIEILNQDNGEIGEAITLAFDQKFKDFDKPILILYRLQ